VKFLVYLDMFLFGSHGYLSQGLGRIDKTIPPIILPRQDPITTNISWRRFTAAPLLPADRREAPGEAAKRHARPKARELVEPPVRGSSQLLPTKESLEG
jgi:hypothetical protein